MRFSRPQISEYHNLSFDMRRQLKVFTGDHMMYANVNRDDSISAFGVGTYTKDTTNTDSITLYEHIVYRSNDTTVNTNPVTYKLTIQKTERGFKQMIPQIEYMGRRPKLEEEYKNVGLPVKFPLDGVWKQTSSYLIRGKDTTYNSATQFKTYYAGHFMWGNTYKDSTNKTRTGVGFGYFEVEGDNKIKEMLEFSTYMAMAGREFEVQYETMGDNEYKQTIVQENGDINVEHYERMTK